MTYVNPSYPPYTYNPPATVWPTTYPVSIYVNKTVALPDLNPPTKPKPEGEAMRSEDV